jgi:hypothetical protein
MLIQDHPGKRWLSRWKYEMRTVLILRQISESIIKCLAQSDIKLFVFRLCRCPLTHTVYSPQPIPIMSLEVHGVPLKHCDQMYAGRDSFIVNVPDKVDTFLGLWIITDYYRTEKSTHYKFSSLQFKASTPGFHFLVLHLTRHFGRVTDTTLAHCCQITMRVCTPPLLAGWEVKSETESPQTVNLKIGESYLPLFRTILSGRKVVGFRHGIESTYLLTRKAHLLGIPTGSKVRSSLSGAISCEKPVSPSQASR